jgi:quercetin dioxygenase-like cupin family protein
MSFPPVPPSARPAADPGRGFVLGPDDGDAYHWLGSLTLTKVLGSATGGGLDIVDHRVPPGYAPPTHVHRDADEVFYLVDGTLAVTCGDDRWQVGPGSLVFLPRGIAHGFVAGDDRPVRTLLVNAPAGFGDVIIELGVDAGGLELPGPDVPLPDPDRIAEVSARHGIEPAPPAAG